MISLSSFISRYDMIKTPKNITLAPIQVKRSGVSLKTYYPIKEANTKLRNEYGCVILTSTNLYA